MKEQVEIAIKNQLIFWVGINYTDLFFFSNKCICCIQWYTHKHGRKKGNNI